MEMELGGRGACAAAAKQDGRSPRTVVVGVKRRPTISRDNLVGDVDHSTTIECTTQLFKYLASIERLGKTVLRGHERVKGSHAKEII